MAFKEMAHQNLVAISMSDVLNHPWFEDLKDKPNGLEAILYTMGLDVSLPYETTTCTHRSMMTQQVVTCERFSGSERKDENWHKIKYRLSAQ